MAHGGSLGPGQFDSHSPDSGYIEILFDDVTSGTSKATELNIHVKDCGGTNRQEDLLKLTKITIPTSAGAVELELDNAAAFTNHVHFDVKPVGTGTLLVAANVTENACSDVDFFPTVATSFRTNQYNAVYNDAQVLRRSQYIFEVDNQRSGSSVAPQNIQSILAGTAVTASVQDSNYTSNRIINGRYVGTKTDTADYGIASALSGRTFQGIVYDRSVEDVAIISQSDSATQDRVREFVFTTDPVITYANQIGAYEVFSGSLSLDLPNARYLNLLGDTTNVRNQSIQNGTSGFVHISSSNLNTHHGTRSSAKGKTFDSFGSFTDGEPFLITNSSNGREFLQSNGIVNTMEGGSDPSGSTLAPFTQIFIQTGSRNFPSYENATDPFTGINTRNKSSSPDDRYKKTTIFGDTWGVFKIIGDTIFESKGNQLATIADKKIYVVDTQEILYIDYRGMAILNLGDRQNI